MKISTENQLYKDAYAITMGVLSELFDSTEILQDEKFNFTLRKAINSKMLSNYRLSKSTAKIRERVNKHRSQNGN